MGGINNRILGDSIMSIFLYKVTNKINDKIYIGVHVGDENDSYLGSGKAIKNAIQKYGIDSFTREIVQTFSTEEEAYAAESAIVDKEFVLRDDTYNLMPGGKGGWGHVDMRGDKNPMKRPEIAAKVSEKIKASITDEERKRRSDRMRRTVLAFAVSPRKGKKLSDAAKALISKSLTGRPNALKGKKRGPDSEETKAKKRLAAKTRIENGFDIGALGRGKTYKMQKKTCPHCGIIGSGGNMTRYHFDKCKSKY